MQRLTPYLLAALFLLASGDPALAKKKVNLPLPEHATFTLIDGSEVTMGELRGRAVLLDFWATWCQPCVSAIPVLARMQHRMADQPFALLSVSIDRNRELLEKFVVEHEMSWLQAWDGDRAINNALGVKGYPTYILIDYEGRIVGSLIGAGMTNDALLARETGRQVGRAKKALKKAAKQQDP